MPNVYDKNQFADVDKTLIEENDLIVGDLAN